MDVATSRLPKDRIEGLDDDRASRFAKWLAATWQSGLLPRPRLDTVRSKAAELAMNASDDTWQLALDQLLDSLRKEAELNEIGLTFAYAQLAALLRQRQLAQRLWRRKPEILELPIERPVIVLGHMRSGTTRLQRLLGCDARFAHTRFYEVMSPVPSIPDLRKPKSWAQLKLLNFLNPQLQAVHPTSATSVEEAFGLLSFSFYGAQIEAQWRVPSFARFWEARDKSWVYREFRHLLQTIAWQRGETTKPWVLKAPQFMEDLEPLLEVFPDARLICLHREPSDVVASSASLVWNQMKLQSNAADRHWIGAEWLRKTARREHICASVRAVRPDVPQMDTEFAAMNRDWRGEMRRIYAFLELELTRDVERRMERYLAAAEKSGFRRHSYRAEDFGLTPEIMRNAVGA